MSTAASPGRVFAALASAATPGRVKGRGGGRYLLEFSAPWGLQLLTSNISPERTPLFVEQNVSAAGEPELGRESAYVFKRDCCLLKPLFWSAR